MRFLSLFASAPRQFVRLRNAREGSAAVEFALVAMPFFFLLFAMIEVGIAMIANQVLETAVQDTARTVMTGQSQASATPKTVNGVTETSAQANARVMTEFKTTLCSKATAMFNCSEIDVDIRSFASTGTVSLPQPSSSCAMAAAFETGGPNDIVIVRAFYKWPTFATFLNFANCGGTNKRLLVATAAFRNEPF